MIHHMKLNPEPFDKIKSGTKTIELRLYDEKRRLVHTGDIIEFEDTENSGRKMRVKVTALHCFSSFDELYKALPLLKCGYTRETVKYASPDDMNAYYSVEMQEKYGVVGIEIKLEKE